MKAHSVFWFLDPTIWSIWMAQFLSRVNYMWVCLYACVCIFVDSNGFSIKAVFHWFTVYETHITEWHFWRMDVILCILCHFAVCVRVCYHLVQLQFWRILEMTSISSWWRNLTSILIQTEFKQPEQWQEKIPTASSSIFRPQSNHFAALVWNYTTFIC